MQFLALKQVYPFNPEAVPDYTFIQESADVSSNTFITRVINITFAEEEDEDGPILYRSSEPRRDTSP